MAWPSQTPLDPILTRLLFPKKYNHVPKVLLSMPTMATPVISHTTQHTMGRRKEASVEKRMEIIEMPKARTPLQETIIS